MAFILQSVHHIIKFGGDAYPKRQSVKQIEPSSLVLYQSSSITELPHPEKTVVLTLNMVKTKLKFQFCK